jgi:hypothetical protein
MPRKDGRGWEGEKEECFSEICDLYQQNAGKRGSKIVPLRQLVRLKEKRKINETLPMTQKNTQSDLDVAPSQMLSSRRGRLTCTVSRDYPKTFKCISPAQSWLCCDREESLERY